MPEIQPFDLRISGDSVPVKWGRFTDSMNTAANGFAAEIVVNRLTQPLLYEAIKPYRYSFANLFIDNELVLTGKITKTIPQKTISGATYEIHGFSNTFNFIDSALIPPYAKYKNQNLHQMATIAAKETGTLVIFEAKPGGIFSDEKPTTGQSAFEFLAPLARKRSQLISCTPEGALLFQQADTQKLSVGSIIEDDPGSLLAKEYKIEFDGRRRFRTYTVTGRTPKGPGSGTSDPDPNIKEIRHKIVSVSSLGKGEFKEQAEWQAHLAVIDAMTFQVPVVGWNAPDKSLWKSNTLISIQSETMFIPDGFTFMIKEVEFSYFPGAGKTAILSLIPPNAYTQNPIDEPWF